jgi:hypothetical protein
LFCFTHDPESHRERQAACRAGGRTRSQRAAVLPEAADVKFEAIADVVNLLAETTSQVRRGEVDVRVANAVGYLGSIALRALQAADIETRLAAVEAELAKKRG